MVVRLVIASFRILCNVPWKATIFAAMPVHDVNVLADHRSIKRSMIPFAATGIFVPGPHTSKQPAFFSKSKSFGCIGPGMELRM